MTTAPHPKIPFHAERGSFDITTYDSVVSYPSKVKYSFGRDKRFPSPRQNNKELAYPLPCQKVARATGFGIGERFKSNKALFGRNLSPSPDTYKLPSLFSPNNTTSTFAIHNKGAKSFAFGTGREDFRKAVPMRNVGYAHLGADLCNPGPALYQQEKPLGQEAVAYSLSYKIDYHDIAKNAIKRGIPGVGKYDDQMQLDPVGRYSNSQYASSKAPVVGKDQKLKPPLVSYLSNPGPGTHEHIGGCHAENQPISQYHTIKTRTFGNAARPEWYQGANGRTTRFKTPGPGDYQPPCDFGYITMAANNRENTYSISNKLSHIYGQTQSMNKPNLYLRNNIGKKKNSLGSLIEQSPLGSQMYATDQKITEMETGQNRRYTKSREQRRIAAKRNSNITYAYHTELQSPIAGLVPSVIKDNIMKSRSNVAPGSGGHQMWKTTGGFNGLREKPTVTNVSSNQYIAGENTEASMNQHNLTDEASLKAALNQRASKDLQQNHLQSAQILDKKLYKVNSDKDTINGSVEHNPYSLKKKDQEDQMALSP